MPLIAALVKKNGAGKKYIDTGALSRLAQLLAGGEGTQISLSNETHNNNGSMLPHATCHMLHAVQQLLLQLQLQAGARDVKGGGPNMLTMRTFWHFKRLEGKASQGG